MNPLFWLSVPDLLGKLAGHCVPVGTWVDSIRHVATVRGLAAVIRTVVVVRPIGIAVHKLIDPWVKIPLPLVVPVCIRMAVLCDVRAFIP